MLIKDFLKLDTKFKIIILFGDLNRQNQQVSFNRENKNI